MATNITPLSNITITEGDLLQFSAEITTDVSNVQAYTVTFTHESFYTGGLPQETVRIVSTDATVTATLSARPATLDYDGNWTISTIVEDDSVPPFYESATDETFEVTVNPYVPPTPTPTPTPTPSGPVAGRSWDEHLRLRLLGYI